MTNNPYHHDPYAGESETPTRWAVNCREHGLVYLTEAEYDFQMSRPDSLWRCPHVEEEVSHGHHDGHAHSHGRICDAPATWDDDTYEGAMEADNEAAREEAAEREFDLRREERDFD